jgi:hypothetical protein
MRRSGSWRPGCPVPLRRLRVLTVGYIGFDHAAHSGRLVVNVTAVPALREAFARLRRARFPIRRIELVDRYGASDERSMRADNTSAFNCRRVSGTRVWSQHAYGLAVDLNPFENPEIDHGRVDPPTAARFADRTRWAPGMVRAGGPAVRAFAAVGWRWGGAWHSPKDYQHFSASGT